MFEPKTAPLSHQKIDFDRFKDSQYFGLFWEQGCGKTKTAIDIAALRYLNKEIDTLIVVAPSSIPMNWKTDELPKHLIDYVSKRTFSFVYRTKKANTHRHAKQVYNLLNFDGFAVLLISYDSVMTDKGLKAVKNMLTKRGGSMLVLDESHYIAKPESKRTKRIRALSHYAKFRTIMTGTPQDKNPLDIYAQLAFLDRQIWRDIGCDDFFAFSTQFGIFRTMTREIFNRKTQEMQEISYQEVVGFKNLNQLSKIVSIHTSRVLKTDVLDLPPKLYTCRYFEMGAQQRELYKKLEQEFLLGVAGEEEGVPLAITRLIRLGQITSGYYPRTEDIDDLGETTMRRIDDGQGRFDVIMEICDSLSHQAIIWAKYNQDIDMIMERLGDRAVRYDGKIKVEQRDINKLRFQRGEVQFFVGKPQVGAEGLTFTNAKTVIYCNNGNRLIHRLQSEDRAHRIGQEHCVEYIDIVAQGSVDKVIVDGLIRKKDLADIVLGDEESNWLEWAQKRNSEDV